MNNDRILKKSFFGGFKREDVLSYVEKLQNENCALADELRSRSAECAQLNAAKSEYDAIKNENASLKEQNFALNSQVSEFNDRESFLRQTNSELSLRVNKAEAMIEEYSHIIDALKEKCAELENANTQAQNSVQFNSELEAKVISADAKSADLEEKLAESDRKIVILNAELAAEKEKTSVIETELQKVSDGKSNTLIQNAMKYSDTLISQANTTAENKLNEADDKLNAVSSEISGAGERLKTAQSNLEYSLGSIQSSVDSLLKVLSECSSELSSGD